MSPEYNNETKYKSLLHGNYLALICQIYEFYRFGLAIELPAGRD